MGDAEERRFGHQPLVPRPERHPGSEHDGGEQLRIDEVRIGSVQVIDPHRGVDEDRVLPRIAVPPRRARLRIAAAEQREPSGALTLDQCREPLA